jgi:sulfopropanediol 3-dehydrogenase
MSCTAATDLHDYEQRELAGRVAPLIDAVRRRGDDALPRTALALSAREIQRCVSALPATVIDDLRLAQDRMRRFAEAQRAAICDFEAEALPGVRCGVRHVAVGSVGVCLPPEVDELSLEAAQAAVIAASAAGVRRIVACVPGGKTARPAVTRPSGLLVGALAMAGAHEIYLTAGVRALAALTFGTESIPRVESVVAADARDEAMTEASRQLAAIGVGRLRPGILILADDEADPDLVAAELISAYGCGPNSRGVAITTSPVLAARVSGAVERQLDLCRGGDGAARWWYERGSVELASDRDAACRLANRHGLECVEIMAGDPRWYLGQLRRCRRVFIGESAGAALAEQMLGDAMSLTSFVRAISYREGHARRAPAPRRLPALAALADS